MRCRHHRPSSTTAGAEQGLGGWELGENQEKKRMRHSHQVSTLDFPELFVLQMCT